VGGAAGPVDGRGAVGWRQRAYVEGRALLLVADQFDGSGGALHFADAAAHAAIPVALDRVAGVRKGAESAGLDAIAAARAELPIDFGHLARTQLQRNVELEHGLDAAAAALAAIADGIEAVQHGVFEPGRVHVAAGVLRLEQLERFGRRQPARGCEVIESEIGDRRADDHADVDGLAMGGPVEAA